MKDIRSLSHTSWDCKYHLATLEGTAGFRFTKQIFQESFINNEMNMVNYHKRYPIFGTPDIGCNPIK